MSEKRSIAFGSPSRYIQGPGEFGNLPVHSAAYGNRVFAVIDAFFFEDFREKLEKAYAEHGASFQAAVFQTEITEESVQAGIGGAEDFEAGV